jgi:dUTP pyrophosphatase
MRIKLYDEEMMPTRAHPTDAGLDLKSTETVALKPGLTQMIDTGVSVAIPEGYVGLLFSRSSYAKHNITLARSY